jgi:hypothetical protein
MKPTLNRFANQYIALGCGSLFPAIVGLLALRTSPSLLASYGKQAMIFLMIEVIVGIGAIIAGVMRTLRTVDVLGQASPLCVECEQGNRRQGPRNFPYDVSALKKMFQTESCFVYPSEGLADRLLHQFYPKVISCSPVLQDKAREHFLRAFTAILTCCLFFLMIFSAFLGLFANHETAPIQWTAIIYFYFLCPNSVIRQKTLSPTRTGLFIIAAIFFPAVVALAKGNNLPTLSNWVFFCLAIAVGLPMLQLWCFFAFLKKRLEQLRTKSQTSARRMRLKGRLIPEAVYQHFSAAFKRETSPGNLCYENSRGPMPQPGSLTAGHGGSISGEIVVESDPALSGSAAISVGYWGWAGVAVALAGLYFVLVSVSPGVLSFSVFVAALMMIKYGLQLLHTAEFFSSECLFLSRLMFFSLEGTFTTSQTKDTVGSAHTREESPNIDVEVKVISADVISTVFAKPGQALPFQGLPRHVLGFDQSDGFIDAVFNDMTNELSEQNTLIPLDLTFSGPPLQGAQQKRLPSFK